MNTTLPISSTTADSEYPRWSETLRNHSHVLIRPMTTLDKAAEREFIEGLSAQARRFRFLGGMRCPSEALIENLTNVDHVHDVAFAAVVQNDSQQRIVGVSRYSMSADGTSCECAVTVSDDWQNQGLGTLLMKHLISVARAHGIRTMFSTDSVENTRMEELARFLGFHRRMDPNDGSQVIHELAL